MAGKGKEGRVATSGLVVWPLWPLHSPALLCGPQDGFLSS